MKAVVDKIGPLIISINGDVLANYQGGIINDYNCSYEISHNGLAVGYGTDPKTGLDFWIVKNSWGPDWGILFNLFKFL